MKTVSLLIKPASGRCNMQCRYCFYRDLTETRMEADVGLMHTETTEALVRSAFQSVDAGGEIAFSFQGGEPTLVGLYYFQHFMELEQKYRRPGIRVTHAIQTNGLLIDEAWASFFKAHHFLVGISVDGTKDIHDFYRMDGRQKGTWNRVARAVALLQKYAVEVNLLCVVTDRCAQGALRTYNSLKRLQAGYLQFIPCLPPLDTNETFWGCSPRSDVYGKFLCRLFDAWFLDWKNGQYVSIRLFDDYVHLLMGLPAGTCSTTGQCGGYLVVEADGSLYPCDFYALDDWKLGRVGEDALSEVMLGEKAQKFQAESLKRPDTCAQCRWRGLCNGGCKRDWVVTTGSPENRYCSAYQHFFEYAGPRLAEIAAEELRLQRSLVCSQ